MSLYAFLGWGSALNFAFIFSAISTPACLSHTLYISALLPLAQPLTVTSSFSDDPKYTEDFSHFLCLAEEFSKNMCASNSEHFFPHCNPSPTVVASAMHSVTHKIQRFSLRIFFFSSVLSCPQLAGVDLSHKRGHYELSRSYASSQKPLPGAPRIPGQGELFPALSPSLSSILTPDSDELYHLIQ